MAVKSKFGGGEFNPEWMPKVGPLCFRRCRAVRSYSDVRSSTKSPPRPRLLHPLQHQVLSTTVRLPAQHGAQYTGGKSVVRKPRPRPSLLPRLLRPLLPQPRNPRICLRGHSGSVCGLSCSSEWAILTWHCFSQSVAVSRAHHGHVFLTSAC